ncbi:MAG: acetyltransferase [Alphaproteobacteria bacterium]|nr:acetyltransferase [Alphaproteobacteria bacterium]
MASAEPIVVFGSGEIATLARYYFDNDSSYRVAGFIVDDEFANVSELEGLPVVSLSRVAERFPPGRFKAHVALSYRGLNRFRERAFQALKARSYTLVSYFCSRGVRWPDLKHGENCFVLENQTLQPTVTLGDNVMLWSGNHIGHGTVIGDHTYVSSHVVLAGHVKIGQRCFVGINATVKDFTTIGDDTFIAMGAAVTKDVPSGSVVIGAAATILPADDPGAGRLRRKYFGDLPPDSR